LQTAGNTVYKQTPTGYSTAAFDKRVEGWNLCSVYCTVLREREESTLKSDL